MSTRRGKIGEQSGMTKKAPEIMETDHNCVNWVMQICKQKQSQAKYINITTTNDRKLVRQINFILPIVWKTHQQSCGHNKEHYPNTAGQFKSIESDKVWEHKIGTAGCNQGKGYSFPSVMLLLDYASLSTLMVFDYVYLFFVFVVVMGGFMLPHTSKHAAPFMRLWYHRGTLAGNANATT